MARGYPDFEGDKSKVYSGADWSAIEAYDKNFYTTVNNIVVNGSFNTDYAIPAGKTLYVIFLACHGQAFNNADKDKNQMCDVRLLIVVPLTLLVVIQGNGGANSNFTKPVAISGGQTARFAIDNRSNHSMNLGFTALCYEV